MIHNFCEIDLLTNLASYKQVCPSNLVLQGSARASDSEDFEKTFRESLEAIFDFKIQSSHQLKAPFSAN